MIFSARRVVLLVLSILLAIALIGAQFYFTQIDAGRVLQITLGTHIGLFVVIAITTALHLSLSAQKWRLVMQVADQSPQKPPYLFYLTYTCLGDLFAQIVPITLSVPLARTIGTRFYPGQQASRGLAASLYEQAFDFLVLFVFALPGILLVTGTLTLWQWGILLLIVLIAAGIAISLFTRQVFRFGAWMLAQISRVIKPAAGLHQLALAIVDSDLPSFRLSGALYVLAVVRLLNLMLRAYAAALAAGLSVSLFDLMSIMPLAQFAILISITPGNLGVTEWTWTGLLVAFANVGAQAASEFTLVHRLLAYFAVVSFSVLVFILSAIQYRQQNDPRSAQG